MPQDDLPFDIQPDAGEPLNWRDKRRFQRIFTNQAVRSYLYLSFGMGLVALLLPVLLILVGGYRGNYSISHFYHVEGTRDILVGSLCATGVFLFLFHGLSRLENWLLNLAGLAAISVALNPTSVEQCGRGGHFPSVHVVSAVLFFVLLAIVAVALSKGRIDYIIYPPKRRAFKRAYNAAGFAMIAMPLAVAATHFLKKTGSIDHDCTHWIFWIECFGIWAFSFYWFVKTLEYRILLRIR